MRKIFLLFVVIFAACALSYAQDVNPGNYAKAVDFLNCKTIELSLQKEKDSPASEANKINLPTNYEKYIKLFPCDQITSQKDMVLFLQNNRNYKKTIAVSTEVDKLKASFETNSQLDKAITFLPAELLNIFKSKIKNKQNIEVYKYPQLAEFAENEGSSSDFKNTLEKGLRVKLSGTEVTPPKPEESKTPSPTPGNAGGDWPSDVDWAVISGLMVTMVLIGIIFWIIRGLQTNATALNKTILLMEGDLRSLKTGRGSAARPAVTVVSARSGDDDSDLRTHVAELTESVEWLIAKYQEQKASETNSLNETQSSQPAEPTREVFYLSIPNEDGSFNNKYASPIYKEGTSVYKFTKTSNNEADFKIDEREASVRSVLEFPDKNIDPVCEAENAFNPRASRIYTPPDRVGKAELIGDKWKVTRKARITYEG